MQLTRAEQRKSRKRLRLVEWSNFQGQLVRGRGEEGRIRTGDAQSVDRGDNKQLAETEKTPGNGLPSRVSKDSEVGLIPERTLVSAEAAASARSPQLCNGSSRHCGQVERRSVPILTVRFDADGGRHWTQKREQ